MFLSKVNRIGVLCSVPVKALLYLTEVLLFQNYLQQRQARHCLQYTVLHLRSPNLRDSGSDFLKQYTIVLEKVFGLKSSLSLIKKITVLKNVLKPPENITESF